MDASEEILAVLREIRDQQRRQIELYETWRAESVENHQEWRRQSEIYKTHSERYDESNRLHAESTKSYDEANRLYIASMKRANWAGPVILAVLLLAVVGTIFAASLGLFKASPP